jgi:hypothetical protein
LWSVASVALIDLNWDVFEEHVSDRSGNDEEDDPLFEVIT